MTVAAANVKNAIPMEASIPGVSRFKSPPRTIYAKSEQREIIALGRAEGSCQLQLDRRSFLGNHYIHEKRKTGKEVKTEFKSNESVIFDEKLPKNVRQIISGLILSLSKTFRRRCHHASQRIHLRQ